MKISNSKKQLAKIIHENGGWREGASFASQGSKSGAIGFVRTRPRRSGDVWQTVESALVAVIHPDALIPNWHQTILSREEYFNLYPEPDADECVSFGSSVERDNAKWLADGKINTGTFGAMPPPTIEQLAADYQQAAMLAEIKQNDADAAKADADARLKALELAGEAIGLLVSPINEKQEPEMVITDWRDLQVGDEISVKHLKNVYSKSSVLVVGAREVAIRNHAGARKTVNLDETDWSFIRRP